ncbi:MAG: uracil-DNA glycosylase [Alphaproteobacteria bacterium]|nr:uracil-DNA glycosylase [Alphaproteobacteria bacterium]
MESNLYKHILQFYNYLGIDILFSSISNTTTFEHSNNIQKVSSKLNNVTKAGVVVNNPKKLNNVFNNSLSNDSSNNLNNNHITDSNVFYNNNPQVESNPQLKQLLEEINNIDCLIKHTARNTVIFDGDINSKVMIIGEAPGQEEDIQGKPFVGQSGILLNNMLQAVGLSRQDVIISNIVFWRPPLNRTPSTDEVSLCLPYIKRLIKIINPEILLLLGAVSNHALLNTMASMSTLRGSVNHVLDIKTISTYHPAYLLRGSSQKKQVFKDLLLLKHILSSYTI